MKHGKLKRMRMKQFTTPVETRERALIIMDKLIEVTNRYLVRNNLMPISYTLATYYTDRTKIDNATFDYLFFAPREIASIFNPTTIERMFAWIQKYLNVDMKFTLLTAQPYYEDHYFLLGIGDWLAFQRCDLQVHDEIYWYTRREIRILR
jgi:hypothetical protein